MAAIRVTPATALSTVRQLGADLLKWVNEAGQLSAAPHLGRQVQDFSAALGNPISVEVWLDDGTPTEDAARWLFGAEPAVSSVIPAGSATHDGLIGSRPARLVFSTSAQPLRSPTGQLSPALLVWMQSEDSTTSEATIDNRPLVLVTGKTLPIGDPRGAQDHITVQRSEPSGVLARLFESQAMSQAPELFQADAGARALEALAAIAGLAFEQEGRSIRAKRTLTQQRAAATQARPGAVPLNELVAGLRARLQRNFGDLARGIDERFELTFASQASAFWRNVDEQLAQVNALDSEPRVKTVATRLPAETEENWLQMLRLALWQHCVSDLGALRDTLRAAGNDVERAVAEADGPPMVVRFQQISDDRLIRILDAHLLFQRKYQGEMPKRGALEYMMMARRYQTIAFMFLSAFGLSFLRQYREFMIPAAIALLSLGVLQMIHSVGRERAETLAKELEKIRDLLRAESRRIVGEVQRAWPALISQHLSDQLPLVLGQVEASIREQLSRQANEGTEERQRLQRQLQAFEVAERKLTAPEKAREGVAQGVAQVRGELRQLIANALRGATV